MANRPTHSRKPNARPNGRSSKHRSTQHTDPTAQPRLQKVLAAAGLGSRRDCEELIREGRVEIDRCVVAQLGTRVDPLVQEIRVDGEPLAHGKRQYFALNKPVGVVSTARDPAGRPRVTDLIKTSQRLFPVGRLDISSEGLIIVTNDGDLANLLAHPRYEVEKIYLAQVAGNPARDALAKLERGVRLAEGFAHAKRVRIKSQQKHSATLEMVLDEGRNREVRRLLARIGHKVLRLKRIAIGPLRLGNLAPGEYRPLRPDEVRGLKDAAVAALTRGRTAGGERTRKAASNTTNDTPAKPRGLPVRPTAEQNPDFDVPRRPGTIIGADEAVAASPKHTVTPAQKRPVETIRSRQVTPLIDVRRGIFPGAVVDDFDEDEVPFRAPATQPASPSKRPPRGLRRSKRSSEPGASRRQTGKPGSKKPLRRKGRRR